jgi:HEAT repeat protein
LLEDIAIIAGHMGTDGAMEAALTVARRGGDARVRAIAVSCIGVFRQKRADAELLTFLGSKDTEVRIAGIGALGARRNPAALGPLLRAMKDSRLLQWQILPLLRGFRDSPAARAAIMEALKDPDPEVRWRAKDALESETDEDAEY